MKSNLRLRVLLPTAVLALLGIGAFAFAFSGTPDGGAPTTPIPPQNPAPPVADVKLSAWAKQANRICRNLNQDNAEIRIPQSRDEIPILVTQSLANATAALAELRALPMPPRQQKRIERMLKHFDQFISLETQAIAAIQASDVTAYAKLTGAAFAANDRGIVLARELGAKACAAGGTDETELARQLERHRIVVVVLYAPDAALDKLSITEARAGASLSGAGFAAINVYDTQEIALIAAEYSTRSAPAVFVFVRNNGAVTLFDGYVDRETVAQAVDNANL